ASLGLRLSLAGSPRPQAESSSLTLRTSHSPPVAPHPASRRRSYLRLREAKPPLDGDLHPAYSQPSQAHECNTFGVKKTSLPALVSTNPPLSGRRSSRVRRAVSSPHLEPVGTQRDAPWPLDHVAGRNCVRCVPFFSPASRSGYR